MRRSAIAILILGLALVWPAPARATATPAEDKPLSPPPLPGVERPASDPAASPIPPALAPAPADAPPPAPPAPQPGEKPLEAAPPAPAAAPTPPAQVVTPPPRPAPAAASAGPSLKYVEMSVGGLPFRVSAGGVLSLHPDAPFRVLKVRSDAWLDIGLKVYAAGMPEVDLGRFHTLSELLGDKVFSQGQVELEVFKGERSLGSVRLTPRLMPIDWLRKAEAAPDLDHKIAFTARALETTPDDRLLMLRLVDLMIEARRYREAADKLEEQPALLGDPALLERLAELYQRLGQTHQEAQVLSQLLEKSPRDARLLERLAGIHEQVERWEEAALMLEALSQAQSEAERGPTWARQGQALLKAGRKTEAVQALERAVRLKPFDPALWQAVAEARALAGDAAGAMEAQRRVVSLAPGDHDAHLRLAQSMLEAGRKRDAAQEMEKAALVRPDEPSLWLRLTRLYEELSDRPAQLKAYRQLARLQPMEADVQFNLAVLLMDQGKPDQALVALEAAAQARPRDPDIQALMLEAMIRLGRWDLVSERALAMVKERPGDPSLPLRLYPQLSKQRPKAMAALLEAALAGGAKDPRLLELRAALALDQEDTEGAIKALEAAAAAKPESLEIKLKLAGLYEAAGKDQAALRLYETILDKNPALEGAQERYLQLKTRLLDKDRPPQAPAPPASPAR